MAAYLSQTLNSDGDSSACTIIPGKHGTFSIVITGTITITLKRSWNNSALAPMQFPDGVTDAVYTSSGHGVVTAPGDYVFTASGTSGGSAIIRMDEIPPT